MTTTHSIKNIHEFGLTASQVGVFFARWASGYVPNKTDFDLIKAGTQQLEELSATITAVRKNRFPERSRSHLNTFSFVVNNSSRMSSLGDLNQLIQQLTKMIADTLSTDRQGPENKDPANLLGLSEFFLTIGNWCLEQQTSEYLTSLGTPHIRKSKP